ncbi:hypothetical protein [Gelidibacter sp.]|uniref:hypothetical protein n=1 Tax=Gelidibacter sp. TaxID=2018083 RepID=UPI0032676664
MKQKIACIGWGSLIWRPERLKIQNYWFEDGPILPIEFTRISSDNRVTLIIDEEAKPIRTLWTLMTCDDLTEAKESLIKREGVKKDSLIHSLTQNDNVTDEIQEDIQNWLKEKKIDCAIWTGLSYSDKTNKERPSIEKIISHLNEIEHNERKLAKEFIRKAPRQIDTEYRRQIEKEFGWNPLNSSNE